MPAEETTTTIIGDYVINTGEYLGDGGQGHVLKGYNKNTMKKVAVKVINIGEGPTRLAFEAEFQAMSRLTSKTKNVCQIKAMFQQNETGYLIMNQYDCDLFAYAIEMRKTSLPEPDLKKLFTKICQGVRELHRERIAHLDLKPENILLNLTTMEPYICDFGSAFTSATSSKNKRRSRASVQQVPALGRRGTRKFSSPEMNNTPFAYDPYRADIYSLGVILHILATTYYPVLGEDNTVDLTWIQDKMELSSGCLELLSSLLHPCPTERFYIDKILEHPWLAAKKKGNFRFVRRAMRAAKPQILTSRRLSVSITTPEK